MIRKNFHHVIDLLIVCAHIEYIENAITRFDEKRNKRNVKEQRENAQFSDRFENDYR